jgi:hypothetical protein
MTKRSRRNHGQAFKAKVALAAVMGEKAGCIGSGMRVPPSADLACPAMR